MPFTELWTWLEGLPLAEHIGFTWWFPFLESIHVLAIGLVVGSILMADLRLLGVAALSYAASRVTRELLPWTWGAVCIAVITGFSLFMTRAATYIENPAVQTKLVLLLLAGVNMALFQTRTFRGIADWDNAAATPVAARVAGATSLLVWAGVVLAGRWVGHSI
jgi:hypothetical protein